MLRFLVWLILAAIGWLFVRSFVRSLIGPPPSRSVGGDRSGPRGPIGPSEALVRDRECETYLPRSRALRVVDPDGSEHFFCSEACRLKHVARASGSSTGS